jgi:hypothetical protein
MKIKCDGKEYKIPDLNVDQWLKIITAYDKFMEKAGGTNLIDPAGVEANLEFFYLLLHDTYPELTRNKLKKMPLYQLGLEFTGQILGALTEIPLGSESAKEKEA